MKKFGSALAIALGAVILALIALTASVVWPVIAQGDEVRRTARIIALALRDDWSESRFAFHATPRLLMTNPKWREDLSVVREKIGPVTYVGEPRLGQVMRDESLPSEIAYWVHVPIQGQRRAGEVHLALTRTQVGFQMVSFKVSDAPEPRSATERP